MRILLTNDDGISSPGITLLAKQLREKGHRVFLVAPDANRSGSSHAINFLLGPLKLKQIEKDTWSCSGTPVDCIIVSLLGGIDEIKITKDGAKLDLAKAPDLILSGINSGANLGTDILYSGTAAAARQGSLFGIPSVALSLVENKNPWNWESVVTYICEQLDTFKSYWKEGTFININFPNIREKPAYLLPTFPSMRYYSDYIVTFSSPDGDTYCFANPGNADNKPEEGSDWAEVLKGNAALCVMKTQPALQEG